MVLYPFFQLIFPINKKRMRTSNHLNCFFLGVLLFTVFSCTEEKPEKPNAEKPKPENSRQVNILVDNSLDFSNYKAHTIIDSISMNNESEQLYAPEGIQSTLFFIDNDSGEVMALVQLDRMSPNVTVNLETVTKSVLSFVPKFNSLTNEQKSDFLQRIQNQDSYLKLKSIVEQILKNKEPIFSERPEFIDQILELNSNILSTYFPDFNPEGGRISLGDESFPSFVRRDNGLTIYNQVSSHVYVNFIPTASGNSTDYILEPKPIYQFGESKVERITLGLKDNCYTAEINQSDSRVISKNQKDLADKMISAFIGVIMADFSGTGINGCLIELSGTISLELGTTMEEIEYLSKVEVLLKTTKTATDLLILAIKEKKCQSLFLNTSAIAKLIASTSNLYVNIYKAAKFTYEVSEASAFAFSLVPSMRINLSERLQIHEGNLIEACVKVVSSTSLEQEYPTGKEILVKIKLEPQSVYGDWKKSGFKVSWKLPPLNGGLSLPSTVTDAEGIASVLWTLPDESNAVVTLSAEIKDEEGDHIAGSPINFQTKVVAIDSTEIYQVSAIGKYKVNNWVGNGPNSELFCELLPDGQVIYTIFKDLSWSDGTAFYARWKIVKINERYYYHESGFWHPGFPNISIDHPLKYPVNNFQFHNNTEYRK